MKNPKTKKAGKQSSKSKSSKPKTSKRKEPTVEKKASEKAHEPKAEPKAKPEAASCKSSVVIASGPVTGDDLGLHGLVTANGTVMFDSNFRPDDKITIQRNGDVIEVTLESKTPERPTGTFTEKTL